MERTELLKALKDGYGSRRSKRRKQEREASSACCEKEEEEEEEETYSIECRNVRILQKMDFSTVLATYEEWQTVGVGGTETARRVSAWFRVVVPPLDNDAATRPLLLLKWLHVHETWLPGKGPVSADQMWTPPPPPPPPPPN